MCFIEEVHMIKKFKQIKINKLKKELVGLSAGMLMANIEFELFLLQQC
jgi:hypothetical protein